MARLKVQVRAIPVRAIVRKRVGKGRPKRPKLLKMRKSAKLVKFAMPILIRLFDSNWVDLHRAEVQGKGPHVQLRWVRA